MNTTMSKDDRFNVGTLPHQANGNLSDFNNYSERDSGVNTNFNVINNQNVNDDLLKAEFQIFQIFVILCVIMLIMYHLPLTKP